MHESGKVADRMHVSFIDCVLDNFYVYGSYNTKIDPLFDAWHQGKQLGKQMSRVKRMCKSGLTLRLWVKS